MPRLSVWFIRAALLYLIAGFTFGALMLANKGLSFSPLLWRLLPIHVEVLLMGWIAQLALGVAYWILPRFRQARGNTQAAWAAFILLNTGIWLAGLSIVYQWPAVGAVVGASRRSWRRGRVCPARLAACQASRCVMANPTMSADPSGFSSLTGFSVRADVGVCLVAGLTTETRRV